jgi:outer membrane biosynthesis protein TonB
MAKSAAASANSEPWVGSSYSEGPTSEGWTSSLSGRVLPQSEAEKLLTYRVKPTYPAEGQAEGISGKVSLVILV